MKAYLICLAALSFLSLNTQAQTQFPFQDPSNKIEVRINDLIKRLSLEEKAQQLLYTAPAIPRLGIPNESLHGVARSGSATVFPQAIGLGATFDTELVKSVSSVISTEARAMYNASIATGNRNRYAGLTFWTPNINIFRDPRWGRGQETYGEDPYLTAATGTAFVKGLQGDNPQYLKVAACAKHFAVHSGPEKLRHEFNAVVSDKDLRETYLPAFKALVDQGVESIMCAYNRTNDEVCCASNTLLSEILRKEWKFKGHVVTDCGAISDFYEGHKIVPDKVKAVALAVKNGVDLNCGDEFKVLNEAVQKGYLTENDIDKSLTNLLRTRFRLGMFDPAGSGPFDNLPASVINSDTHRQLAYEAALKSIVLLKNNGVLPLKNNLPKYYVSGPNATSMEALMGNYYGVNPVMVTILEGLVASIAPGSQMEYKPGILLDRNNVNPIDWTTGESKSTDVSIVVLGINGYIEGEEGESIASEHFGDRLNYDLPKNQIDYLKKLRKENTKPIIAIITGGSPMNLSEVHELADAVLLAWYPGEEGGKAVADIVFGKQSPSGRLPVTFPKSLSQLPAYEDYSMKGRTYRYMTEEPMYPFGYGLSYTKFSYSNIAISSKNIGKNKPVIATATITNTGSQVADDVIQLYVSGPGAGMDNPIYSLKGFKRVHLNPGQSENISFQLSPEQLSTVNKTGATTQSSGVYTIYIGGAVPSKRSEDLGIAKPQTIRFSVR